MKRFAFQNFIVVFSSLLITACAEEQSSAPSERSWEECKAPWLKGAEICRYELKQERYGEIRNGDAIMVFVREPFHRTRQVKDESGTGGGFEVLKLNFTRDFNTGIYPYHTMVSTFQPFIENTAGEALKVTVSVQDWCGHVFSQTNRRNNKLTTEVLSYFEQEDGWKFTEDGKTLLEDGVWTSLRLNPNGLTVGQFEMIPGGLAQRFDHRKSKIETAVAKWLPGSQKSTRIYQIDYPNTGRVLAIEITAKPPYVIQGWTEGVRGNKLTTAQLTHRLENQEYWSKNSNADSNLRKKLGLKP